MQSASEGLDPALPTTETTRKKSESRDLGDDEYDRAYEQGGQEKARLANQLYYTVWITVAARCRIPSAKMLPVVCTQMTKRDLGAVRLGWDGIANLDPVLGHNHSINQ